MYSKEIALETYEKERPGAELDSPLDRIRTDRSLVFDELFERYQAMVFNLAYRILGDREEALDISQEVFLIIYRKLHRFRGDSSLKTWIYRIAINRASNRCRWWNRLRRRGTVSLDQHLAKNPGFHLSETLETDDRSPEENLLSKERSLEIQQSLLRLPVSQRVAVVMRDIEGMSYEEIAASTETTLGTVKSRIARGREELKRHLNGTLS